MEEEDRHSEDEDGENEDLKGTLKCAECDQTFPSASKLKSHTRVHAGQNLFGCTHCPAKFVYENQLKLHSKIHEGSGGYACTRCPATFTLAWSLKLHEKTHTTKKAFPCSECSAKFDSAGSLREHEETHRLPYACMLCTARFSTARDLWEHENVHNDEKSGKVDQPTEVTISVAAEQDSSKTVGKKTLHGCKQCSTWFVSSDHLQKHKCTKSNSNACSEEKPHQCSQCSEKFAKKKSLKEHERKHAKKTKYTARASSDCPSEVVDLTDSRDKSQNTTEVDSLQKAGARSNLGGRDEIVDLTDPTDEPHQNTTVNDCIQEGQDKTVDGNTQHTCLQCNATFRDSYKLNRHMIVHAGKLEHYCSKCPAGFATRKGLEKHWKRHEHHCSKCPAGFATRKDLEKHQKRHEKQQSYSSTQCPAKFTVLSSFKKHRKSHKGAKPFSCPECPAKFVSYVEKKSHMKVHGQEEKTHSCSHCGAKFAHYNSLVSHQRYHQGEKKVVYSCSSCPAKFTQPHSLWLHRRIHGDEAFGCPECPAVFRNRAHLRSHMPVHSGDQNKPYKCQHCSAKYTCISHLTYHEKLHQKEVSCMQPTEASSSINEDKQGVEETGKRKKQVPQQVESGSKQPTEVSSRSNENKQSVEKTGKKRKQGPHQQVAGPSKKSYNCKECPAKFTKGSHLWSHMQVHFGGDKPHPCPHCSAKFVSPYHLSRHQRVHKETDEDGSPVQGVETTPESPRKKQKKPQPPVHDGKATPEAPRKKQKKQQPPLQDGDSTPEAPMKKQKKQQPPASNVRYSCSICSEEFIHPEDLKAHWTTHTNDKIFRCDECPATFLRSGHLSRHQKAHSSDGQHSCPYCSAQYEGLGHLRIHLRLHHSVDDRERPFVCPECPASYLRQDHLKSHLKVHKEGAEPRPNRCQHCTASFFSPSILTKHMKLHTEEDEGNEGVKEHLCPKCPAGFKDASGLSEHLKIHTEKANVCTECPARFSRPDHLRHHMLLHTEVEKDRRRYQCSYCNAKFNAKHGLTNHEKLHNLPSAVAAVGNKTSCKCPHCLRRFRTLKTMKKHIRYCLLAIGNRPYVCSHCPAKFALATTLERHEKTHSCEEPSPTTSTSRPPGEDEKNYHCEECPAKFSSERDLKRHQEIHDSRKPKPYSCSYCTAKFTVTSHLARHVKIHSEVPDVSPQSAPKQVLQSPAKKNDARWVHHCNVCPATFNTQVDLDTHRKVHSQDNLYTCSKCPARFSLQSDLEDHKKTHTATDQESQIAKSSKTAKSTEATSESMMNSGAKKTKWFSCRYCKSQFRGATRLAVHVNVHHWELQQKTTEAASKVQDCFNGKTYKCPQCPSEFAHALSLTVHLRVHQGNRPHRCKVCSAEYANQTSLRRHMRACHDTERRRYCCPHCPARFVRMSHLKAHLIVHTRQGSDLYCCTHCTAKFLHSKELTPHLALHGDKKSFKCDTCSQEFSAMKSLRKHRKIHSKKSFKCDMCSFEFSALKNLRKHLKTHSEKQSSTKQPSDTASSSTVQNDEADMTISSADRPYTCKKCSRKFLSSQQLEYHMVWHSGDRRHECSLCSQNFPTAQSLKEHRKTHAGERPFRCPMCPADFEWKNSLKRHLENKHFKESDESNITVSLTTQRIPQDAEKSSNAGERPFRCPMCPADFEWKNSLKRHVENKHFKGSDESNTTVSLTTQRTLQDAEMSSSVGGNKSSSKQQKTNSGTAKSYTCSVCSLEFSTFKDLKKHRRTHSGGKRSKTTGKRPRCPECNVSFCSLRSLERHKRIHDGERPFGCPRCSVRFMRKDHLMRHVASKHTGKESNSPSMVNQEKYSKPPKKVFNCPDCPAKFGTFELLTHHKKIHSISTKGKATPNNNSLAKSSNPATLEVMETQVVHEPGAASHIEAVIVANLEQLPIHQESGDASVQKVLQTDDQPSSSGTHETVQYHKSHLEGNTTQVATMSREAALTHVRASPLLEQGLPLQKAKEQVPALGNVPLLNGLWQRAETTSPPQGIVPVALSYGEALQAGETILQASMANSYPGYTEGQGKTIRQQITETSSSANSPGMGQAFQVSGGRTNEQMPHDAQLLNANQDHSSLQQNDERRMEKVLNNDAGKDQDIRYFCIGCKQVFATEEGLKDHLHGSLQETPSHAKSSHHKIVILQRKTTDHGKTSACSEANVLAVPKQSMNGVLMNCSHVFCVLCAGKVNINDISHHVKIKHGIYSLDGEYPFGQATSCMTCSRRLYGEEDVQRHTSQKHTVLRDTAGPFLAYDNTQSLSHTEEDPVQDDRQHTTVLGSSANERNILPEASSLSKSDRIADVQEKAPTVTNSSSEKATDHSAVIKTEAEQSNRAMTLLKGAFSLSDAQKKKFLMISRAADACLKKKRYLVIRGSDSTDRSACSSPQTDCSSSHDTTSSPPPSNTLEQLCHIKVEGGENPSACTSNRLNEQPKSDNDSCGLPDLQKRLALVAGILSSSLSKSSSAEQNPNMRDHKDVLNCQVAKPILETKGVKGFRTNVTVKTEPVTSDVDSANVGLSAASDAEDMEDLGDVTAINEPLKSIKEEAILEDF